MSDTFNEGVPRPKSNINQLNHINRKWSSFTANTTAIGSSLHDSHNKNGDHSIGSPSFEGLGDCYNKQQLPDVNILRRDNEGTVPTMFSVMSRSDKSSISSLFRRDPANTSTIPPSFLRFLKYGRRPKQLTEAQLRKQIKRHCECGNWSRVRKLVANHDFTEIPDTEIVPETNPSVEKKSSNSEGKSSLILESVQDQTSRRPSYSSRNVDRLSFTGRESEAVSAAIKAAAAAERSDSDGFSETPDIVCDENILHDICRHNPPRDVIDLLIVGMRHRKGSTCGRDEKGHTPLHVAVASGASSVVIDALVRADPLPATMGDNHGRSPLHLAVKFLAYDERYLIDPVPISSKRSVFKPKKLSGNRTNRTVLSREDAIENTRQIIVILKNAMIIYPGQIDFKGEDITGFAPLDYAIDGSIKDKTILRLLIRRDKSQDLCRRSTSHSQESVATLKTSNSVAGMPAKQKRRSVRSICSVSTRDSLQSQDIDVVHQIEKEEMESRRHRINRLNARKQKKRVQTRLVDIFGIDESGIVLDQPEQLSAGQLPQVSHETARDSFKCHDKETSNNSCHSHFSSRELHNEPEENIVQTIKVTEEEAEGTAAKPMTEEEMYMHHLQLYLEQNMDDCIGDLEYCDDIDYLYDDPEEVQDHPLGLQPSVETKSDDQILDFEICVTHENNLCHFDDCSEITWT